eukprot:GFUD01017233.1.p1 GENE.GFUD01017233.1~~GFUD01017233.1.p1  ORF type:complete len:1724 (+),score=585.73 GFUD01017233.1:81-5252(+)
MEDWALTELQATCSNLGVNDGTAYHPDPDCVECVKDLIRFLRRDDANHEVRRALGEMGVVKSDLVLILRDHSNHRELFDVTLRLLVNLTNPELLLFKEELPEDKETRNFYLQIQNQRQDYKEAFVDQELWTVLSKTLGALLKKDWDERLEDDKLIIERILILVRNVLQVPTNVRREGRTSDDASMHDQVLWVLHQSGMQDLLLYVASSDGEANYCLHVLEIISLMFREQDPMSLASASLGRSKAEKAADEEALANAVRLEDKKEKEKTRQMVTSRHSRFGGTFVLKDVKSITDRDMIVQKPLSDMQDLNFDKKKRGVKRAKNRIAPENLDVVRRSTLPVRIFLKEFCVEFLLSAYNQLMGVVRDALNRQKAQQNDETYYLWCIRFFMQFNRGHDLRIELVSETLSRQTFHFLQQQMDAYRDNFEHEKKNRPKYLMWSRRMHLCIRAYMELLHNLVDMEGSSNPDIKEAGRVLKSSVFYESEYRELCLQQLSSFNPDKMSVGYLTDLVATTHVFLKLMEHMSKNKHLIVSKKTKKKAKKSGKKAAGGEEGSGEREKNEDKWEAISGQLSGILQGRGEELPEGVVPFDGASDVSMEDQKVLCMKSIQKALRNKEVALAVALMRAGREVWPEGDSFGEAGAEAEDEFMALREVLFADLGVEDGPTASENAGEVGEEYDEEEEEEVEEEKVYSVEQEFDYKAFVFRFAVKNVVMPFGVLFTNYAKNSKETNHHIIKMFHRIAVDCELPAILFQASIFRVFQQVWKDLRSNPSDQSLRELAKFAKFILSKFMTVAASNKKVFMELLFWKTSREATEIFEGYGTQASSAKAKKSFWSSEDEDKLSAVFGQVMEMERSGERKEGEGDILDQIELMFSCENRSRRQIGNKLRELGLIKNMGEITKKPLNSSREWKEEELEKLRELFEEYKEAENPGARIYEQWKAAKMPVRSKKKLCDKVVELGWVADRSKLGKIKQKKGRPKEGEAGYLNTKSDSDSALNSSSEEEGDASSEEELNANQVEDTSSAGLDLGDALRSLDGEDQATLSWLAGTLDEEGEDRRMDCDGEDVPLVAVAEVHQLALAKEEMTVVLTSLGLCAPSQGEQFWRIPGDMSVDQLKAKGKVLAAVGRGDGVANAMLGVESSLLVVVRGLGAVVENRNVEKKKKKKRGPNKWMPFRREEGAMPPPPPQEKEKEKKSTKSKNKSFLDSSDEDRDEKEDDVDNVEDIEFNDENADPENKENVPQKKTPTPKKDPPKKLQKLDKARLLKLLNDDSDLGSDDSDDNEPTKGAKSDTSDEGVEDPLPGDSKPEKSKKSRAPRKKQEKTTKPEPKKRNQAAKKASKKAKLEESDNDADSEDDGTEKKQQKKKISKGKKKLMSTDSSDDGVKDDIPASGSEDEVSSKKMSTKKPANKTRIIEKSGKEPKSRKKASVIDSSSDDGVMDPTQPTESPIAAASSDDDKIDKIANSGSKTKKKAILDSDSDDEPIIKSSKKKMSLDSDSEDGGSKTAANLATPQKKTPMKASDPNVSIVGRRSRSRSSSFDSRRSVSPLEDSRISRPSSPNDSRIISPMQDSRLDDSRRSRRSSLDDSRLRSPLSSPLSSRRSSSRSVSPISPTPATHYTLADTPAAKKDKVAKAAMEKGVVSGTTTPATKRGRAPSSGSSRATRSAKKSRVASPDQSLKLQLSETLEPASQESLKLQLSETLDPAKEEEPSPVKKNTRRKKKAVVDSDSD